MDLFTPVVEAARQHIYFRELTSGKHPEKVALLESWSKDFADRDGKFAVEFQTTFNSSFWELYLHEAFTLLGLQIDTSHARPDFLLTRDTGQGFVAEATIASNAEGYVPQWQPVFSALPPVEAMREYQSIRLANAISGKVRKYRDGYSALPHVVGKPYVICVAPFEQQGSHGLGDRAMRRVLFGLDVPLLDTDTQGNLFVVGEAHAERAWKQSGVEVPFGLFRDDTTADVAAVLFGPLATFSKLTAIAGSSAAATYVQALRFNRKGSVPSLYAGELKGYAETTLDGLHLFVNPFARLPLDPSPFKGAGLAVHEFSPAGLALISTVPDKFLLARQVVSVFGRGSVLEPTPPKSSLKRPSIESLPEGVLHRVGGGVGFTTDTHLAHYLGWTILVARDTVDNDWGALARPGLFRDTDSFREANRADDSDAILPSTFLPTKEEALADMMRQVASALHESPRSEPTP